MELSSKKSVSGYLDGEVLYAMQSCGIRTQWRVQHHNQWELGYVASK